MPKISSEHRARIKEAEPKHVFDLCGWEVLIDPLNYQIKKGETRYYWSTFLNMLKGLKAEIDIKSVGDSNTIEDAISKVEANNERFIKDLKAVLSSYTSLGAMEWH